MAILAQPTKAANAVVKIVKPPTSTAPVSAVAAGGSVRAALPNAAQVARTPNAAAAMTTQQRLATDPSFKQSETQRALNVIAQRQAQGQDISMQQKYLQKNLGYQGIIPAGTQAPTNQLQNYVPITSQQQQNNNQSQALFGNALQTLNAQNPQQQQLQDLMQQYVTKAYDPFAYSRETDPNYAAGLAATKQNISSGTNQVMAELNRRGILNSTITGDRSSQIAADAVSNLETQLVPQYYNQAFQMWQAQQNAENQQFGNQMSLAQTYDQQRQQQFGNQRALGTDYNTLAQQDFQNRLSTADRTGNLQSAEAETAIQNIQALKQLASAKGITKEQRDAYSKQASAYRAQLDAMGIDSKQFGSDVTAAQASQRSGVGTRTLAGQQADLQGRQANLDAALNVANMTGRVVNPQSDWTGLFRQANSGKAPLTMAGQNQNFQQGMQNRQQNFTEDSFMKEFNERVRSTGVQEALAWAAQNFQEYSYDRSQTETENQNAISNDQWSQTMAYQQVRDQVGDSQWQAQFDEDTRRYGLDYALNELVTNNQISQSQADSARSDAQLELQQDQFSYGMASDQDAKSQGQTADAYAPYIESVAKYNETVDKLGQPTGQKTLGNPDTVKRSILASGLNDYEQYRLMEMYGLWPSGEPIPPKPKASTNTTLGNLAKKYESSGNPSTIARNAGDIGGASYGTYQITQGTMPGFVSFLKNSGNPLSGLLGSVQIATKEFDKAWKAAASQNGGKTLNAAEEGFIKQSHYDPAASSIKKATGVDVNKRSNAVQQVLWSVSVQHGPGGAKNVFKSAGINNNMTDRQIIDAVYKERKADNGMKYFKSSSPSIRQGVMRRFDEEYKDAVGLL